VFQRGQRRTHLLRAATSVVTAWRANPWRSRWPGVEATLYLRDGFRHGFLNSAGAEEVLGPKAMDDGRLDFEPTTAATRHHAEPGRTHRSSMRRPSPSTSSGLPPPSPRSGPR